MDSILGHEVLMNTKSHSHIHCTFLLLYLFFFFPPPKVFVPFHLLVFFEFALPTSSHCFCPLSWPFEFSCYTCALSALRYSSLWSAMHTEHCQVPLLRTFPHHWEGEALHSKILKCLSSLSNPKGSSLRP